MKFRPKARSTVRRRKKSAVAPVVIPTDEQASERAEILEELKNLRSTKAETEQARLLYRELLDAAPVGFVNLTSDGTIRDANLAAVALLDRTHRQVIGRPFGNFVAKIDAAIFSRHLANCRAAADGDVICELRLAAKKGAVRHIELLSRSCAFGTGVIVYHTLVRDVTERKLAEAELTASQELLRLVAESARDYAIFSVDLQRRVTSWNFGAQRLLGYAEREIIGRSVDIIFTPEDRTKGVPAKQAQRALLEGSAAAERWHVRKDGTRFWANGVVMPMRDADGRTIGLAKIFRDETEALEAREKLEDSRAQLWAALQETERARGEAEAAGKAKDHFLAVLSHELRTPITPIVMGVRSLLRREDLSAGAMAPLEMVLRNVQVEARLIDDLLDMSRIAHGKLEIIREPLDLHEAIEHAVQVVLSDLEAKEQQLELKLSARKHEVVGDGTRLQQMIWNLLKNASKFTPPKAQISIRTQSNRRLVTATVSDSGIGIDPEALSRIFDPFAQADRDITRKYGGLGLGLAISKAAVEAHGGQLRAESDGQGKGAAFIVTLPLR